MVDGLDNDCVPVDGTFEVKLSKKSSLVFHMISSKRKILTIHFSHDKMNYAKSIFQREQ